MSTIDVTNSTQLTSALATAKPGDIIELAAGNYGDVTLSGDAFSSDVTIKSADPSHVAVLNTLTIKSSSNIHVDDIEVAFTPTASTMSFSSAVTISNASGVTLSNSILVGGPAVNGVAPTATGQDATGNVIGLPTGRAITIDHSSATVSGNDISQFDRGVIFNDANGVTLSDNDIHDLRRTAVAGTGSNLTIENNNLHDSHPWRWGDTADGGDHADFIALYTDTNQTAPSTNIVIANNIMSQGAGTAILGMWMQGGAAGFSNVQITGNLIETGNNQGITLTDVAGGSVSQNTLIEPAGGTQAPAIVLEQDVKNVDVGHNQVASVTDQNYGGTGNILHDNTIIQNANPTAGGYYTATLSDTVAKLTSTIQAYSTVASGVTAVIAGPTGPALTASPLLTVGGTHGSVVVGSSSADHLVGGAGNDTLNGGSGGADTLSGGAGDDTYYVNNSTTKVVELAGGGVDTVIAKGDHVLEANVENLVISSAAGNNWGGTGNTLNNVIIGNAGNNALSGLAGNDTLDGGLGNDNISGGDGNDMLLGGGGVDTLSGGNGADTFVASNGYGAERVTDFSQAQGDHVFVVGETYATAQVGADTVVTLASGDKITLANTSLASLKAGWISETSSLFGITPDGDNSAGDTLATHQGTATEAPAAAPAMVMSLWDTTSAAF